ncbi:hypothetical protein BLNAU_21915 [Blattamonas nauphoetae]|uniref:Uncharacterized protein n=1 Tax=Blattamonas nauphoetae TaxID=2049346 RepID=A0ABQ9WUK6_9EUKA|nr:hypothetical protein BLNAU_21915 [Blattamonas nauphoetae]
MPAPNGSTRPTLRHFPVCQPRTRAVCDRLLPSVSVPLHVDIDVVFESKLKWPCITRIQLIVNTISQFLFSETFTPPEPVAGNPLHSHTSMMRPDSRSSTRHTSVHVKHAMLCWINKNASIKKQFSLAYPIISSRSVVKYQRSIINVHPREIKNGVDRTVNCDAPQRVTCSQHSFASRGELASTSPALAGIGAEQRQPARLHTLFPMWVEPHADTSLVEEEIDAYCRSTLLSDTIDSPLLIQPAPSTEPSHIDSKLTRIDNLQRLSSVPTKSSAPHTSRSSNLSVRTPPSTRPTATPREA